MTVVRAGTGTYMEQRAMARVGPGLRDKAGARAAVQPCQDPAPETLPLCTGRSGAPSVGQPGLTCDEMENAQEW